MPRIDVTTDRDKWQWGCPSKKRHRNWRVTDGLFECRQCETTYRELVNLETGETIPREQIEIVGAGADHKGAFGKPTVGGSD